MLATPVHPCELLIRGSALRSATVDSSENCSTRAAADRPPVFYNSRTDSQRNTINSKDEASDTWPAVALPAMCSTLARSGSAFDLLKFAGKKKYQDEEFFFMEPAEGRASLLECLLIEEE